MPISSAVLFYPSCAPLKGRSRLPACGSLLSHPCRRVRFALCHAYTGPFRSSRRFLHWANTCVSCFWPFLLLQLPVDVSDCHLLRPAVKLDWVRKTSQIRSSSINARRGKKPITRKKSDKR